MTVNEIFSKISDHQVEGMMFHDNMADYFDFLGMMGFKRMHEYHFICETVAMRGIHKYFINHYDMLLSDSAVKAENQIPEAWRSFTRQDVENDAKASALKDCIEKWVAWEKETKELYEKSCMELYELGEVSASCKVKKLVCEVDQELKCADRLHLELKAMDWNITIIMLMQDKLHKKYKKKMKKVGVSIC